MKIGFVSAILDGWNFEETIDIASQMGFKCVEVACWPRGKAERRYAGVSHINVDDLSDAKATDILKYCADKGVEISSLAFYPNPMDADLEKRAANIEHLKKVIAASAKLGVNLVTTFVGRDQYKSVEENIELFKSIWPTIIQFAEEKAYASQRKLSHALDHTQWPGGQNGPTPRIWRQLSTSSQEDFVLIMTPTLSRQQIDYIKPLYEFKDAFHVTLKISSCMPINGPGGHYGLPLEYMTPNCRTGRCELEQFRPRSHRY